MGLNLYSNPLFRAVDWLEKHERSRMTAAAKLSNLLLTIGGSYNPNEPERLHIAGVSVSCTGGTHMLLRAWKRKAEAKLNAGKAGA